MSTTAHENICSKLNGQNLFFMTDRNISLKTFTRRARSATCNKTVKDFSNDCKEEY